MWPCQLAITWAVPPIRMMGGAIGLPVQGPVSSTWTSRVGSPGSVTSRISSIKGGMIEAMRVKAFGRKRLRALCRAGEAREVAGKTMRNACEARRSIVVIMVASRGRECSGARPGGRRIPGLLDA